MLVAFQGAQEIIADGGERVFEGSYRFVFVDPEIVHLVEDSSPGFSTIRCETRHGDIFTIVVNVPGSEVAVTINNALETASAGRP